MPTNFLANGSALETALPAETTFLDALGTSFIDDSGQASNRAWSAQKISNELGSISSGYQRLRAVIAIVDNTDDPVASGYETEGNRYILNDAGTAHANWDGAGDWDLVEFVGGSWETVSLEEGMVCYVDDSDLDALYVDDGSVAWELRTAGAPSNALLKDATSLQVVEDEDGGVDLRTNGAQLRVKDSTDDGDALSVGQARTTFVQATPSAAQTVAGEKTFSTRPKTTAGVPGTPADEHLLNKGWGDSLYEDDGAVAAHELSFDHSDLHEHANKAVLDSVTSAGSGSVITSSERTKLADMPAAADVPDLSGDESVTGTWTYASHLPLGPDPYAAPTLDRELAPKKYVDDSITGLSLGTAAQADTGDFEPAAAVSTHEGTYDHGDIPSSDEKAALAGTSGTPGSGNKYVTDDDSRMTDARTPTAHDHDSDYLNLANTTPFTPDADYEPATKKYVDDSMGDLGLETAVQTSFDTNVNPDSTGGLTWDDFGFFVAISADGKTMAVGDDDAGDGDMMGAIQVFVREDSAWIFEAEIRPDPTEGTTWPSFGSEIVLSADGDLLVAADRYAGPGNIGAVQVFSRNGSAWIFEAEFMGDTSGGLSFGDFGKSIALSADGEVLAVGDDEAGDGDTHGAVQVFGRNGGSWDLMADILPDTSGGLSFDNYGQSLAISADGSLLAVGDGQAGDGNTNGAVQVFVRDGAVWTFEADIVPDTSGGLTFRNYGNNMAISADGRILAIGDNAAGPGTNGAVQVFVRDGAVWTFEADIVPDTSGGLTFSFGGFGGANNLSISADGKVLAVGDDGAGDGETEGAVQIFARDGSSWSYKDTVRGDPTGGFSFSQFGFTVALSGYGEILAVGDPGSGTAGVGLVQVFDLTLPFDASLVPTPTQKAALAGAGSPGATNPYATRDYVDDRGIAVSSQDYTEIGGYVIRLSGDGNILVLAEGEVYRRNGTDWILLDDSLESHTDGAAVNFDGSVIAIGNDGGGVSGHGSVRVYRRSGDSWPLEVEIDGDDDGETGSHFGDYNCVALNGRGDVLAVGDAYAPIGSGLVKIYHHDGASWSFEKELVGTDYHAGADNFGQCVAMDGEGSVLAVGDGGEEVCIFRRSDGGVWSFEGQIPETSRQSSYGRVLDVSPGGNVVCVQDRSGSAGGSWRILVYRRSGDGWDKELDLSSTDMYSLCRGIGNSVGVSNDAMIVGAHSGMSGGTDSYFLFGYDGESWSLLSTFGPYDKDEIYRPLVVGISHDGKVAVASDMIPGTPIHYHAITHLVSHRTGLSLSPTETEKEALGNARDPSGDNPYATESFVNRRTLGHAVTSGEVSSGYFTLPSVPLVFSNVRVNVIGGSEQKNAAWGLPNPDFEVDGDQVHIANVVKSGLSGDIAEGDELVVSYEA